MTYKELYDHLHEAVKDDDKRKEIENELELERDDEEKTYYPLKEWVEIGNDREMTDLIEELSGWRVLDHEAEDGYTFVGKDSEEIDDKIVKRFVEMK